MTERTAVERLRDTCDGWDKEGYCGGITTTADLRAVLAEHDALVQERDALEAQVMDLLRDVVKDAEREQESTND